MKIKENMKVLIKVVFVLALFINYSIPASAQSIFQSDKEVSSVQDQTSGGLFGGSGSKQSNLGTKNRLMDEWSDEKLINSENEVETPIGDGAVALILLSFGYIAVRAMRTQLKTRG